MKTNKKINSINFNGDDITSIIKTLDSIKAHGVDNISICMIKLCSDSIILPLTLIFEDCIAKGIFPDLWKLANVIPTHKKESKNIVKNYQPISYYEYLQKFLKDYYLTLCSSIFMKINYLLSVSLVFYQVIHVYHNCYPLYMKFSHLSIHH